MDLFTPDATFALKPNEDELFAGSLSSLLLFVLLDELLEVLLAPLLDVHEVSDVLTVGAPDMGFELPDDAGLFTRK